jgi:hypothetical protein
MASVAGRCPACGVHPSGVVVRSGGPAVRCPAVRCPAVRCPVTRGRRPGPAVRPSAVHPSSVQPSGVRPRRSGRVRLLPPQAVASGAQAGAAGQPSPQEPVEVPVGCRAVQRLGRRPSRPGGRARLPRSRVGQWESVADLGRLGAGGGSSACPAERPGRLGRRAERRGWRRREGTGGGCSARWPHLPRGCRPGLGARPRWVVVAEADARVDGPERGRWACRRDGRAAPARPRLATSASGSLPTAL